MVRSPKPADEKCVTQSTRGGRRSGAVTGLVLMGVVLGGCVVAESKYKAAVAESEEVKAELERTQTQTNALEQQTKSIKDQMDKLTAESAAASAELQRLQGSRDAERESMEEEVRKLEQETAKLTAQQRALRHEHAAVEKENTSLKATVARYQKELKDRGQPAGAPAAKVSPPPAGLGMMAAKSQEAQAGPLTTAKAPSTGEGATAAGPAAKPKEPAASQPAKESPPAEEPTGFLALLKKWLSSIWHLFF